MARGDVIVEATTSSSTEPLLPNKASYTCCLSYIDDELRSFRSCLKWMCVDQSNARHAVVSWSLLLGVFIPIASRFVLSYAPTRRTYDMVVQLSLTSAFASPPSFVATVSVASSSSTR